MSIVQGRGGPWWQKHDHANYAHSCKIGMVSSYFHSYPSAYIILICVSLFICSVGFSPFQKLSGWQTDEDVTLWQSKGMDSIHTPPGPLSSSALIKIAYFFPINSLHPPTIYSPLRFIRTHLHNFCFPLNALSTPPHIISMPFLFLLQLLPHLSFILQFLLLPFLLQLLTPFIPFLFFLQLQPDILSFLLLLVLLILFLSFLFLLATPSRSRVVFFYLFENLI